MLKGRTALVVDDDAHSLVIISGLLREMDISFKRNTTGNAVIDKLQASPENKPDFILMDMDLPEGDPCDIVRTLRQDPNLADIPVIAIADDPTVGSLPALQKAGFNGFMAKPLPRRSFGRTLLRILAGESVWTRA